MIKNTSRVISRSDIRREEFTRAKIIPEDPALADRLNVVIEQHTKYLTKPNRAAQKTSDV